MPGIRELAVQPFRGTQTIAGSVRDKRNHLADLALQKDNQAIRNRQLDQRDRQIQQGEDRIGIASEQLGMRREEMEREMFIESVGLGANAEEAAAIFQQYSGVPTDEEDLVALRKLPPEVFGTARKQAPAGVQEFEMLTEGMSPEDVERARRTKLGFEPRAVTAAPKVTMIGDVPHVFDPSSQTMKPVEVEGVRQTSEVVADNAGTVAAGKAAGTAAIKASDDARKQLTTINSNIAKYDEAIQLLEDGAQTGAVVSSLPSVQAASVQLDNVQRQLGLNVIEQVTFGALSEGELQLALETALPTNLPRKELIQWLVSKKSAQEKLAKELEGAAIFLGTPGNTVAEYMQLMQSAREVDAAVPQGVKSGRFTVRQR